MANLLEFAQLLHTTPLDLCHAGLVYARNLAYPDLQIPSHLDQIDQFAEQAQQIVEGWQTTADQAQSLAHFLFVIEKFRGNMRSYGDPRNSFLNEVINRRLGIPITLSVIYITIARKLGIEAYGVGLPGHFVVGVDTGDNFPLLLDPFHQGRVITEQDCADLISQSTGYRGPIQPEWLEPQTDQLILTRMLNNLRYAYIRTENWPQAIAIIQHMRFVQPEMPELQRDEGLLRFQQREFYNAAQLLQSYLEQNPAAPDGDAIRQNMGRALSGWVKQN